MNQLEERPGKLGDLFRERRKDFYIVSQAFKHAGDRGFND
jgi:hypothetical protein